jgi:hypothetical protein
MTTPRRYPLRPSMPSDEAKALPAAVICAAT